MNCKLRKIRAKVVFFRELRGICVKKSGDFRLTEKYEGHKMANILRFLQFLAKNILRFLQKYCSQDYQKDEIVTCLPVYYAGLLLRFHLISN